VIGHRSSVINKLIPITHAERKEEVPGMAGERFAIPWRELALAAGLAVPGLAWGQAPQPPTGPVPAPADGATCGGPLRRALHHVGHSLHDKFIGYPENFVEPPLGASLYETLGVMKAHADGHDFFLYRSDFVAGSTTLTPGGAQRLTVMANRLPAWLGPIVLEWTPDQPGMADARRQAVLNSLRKAGIDVGPERVAVGPSPYNGLNGQEADQDYRLYLNRAAFAPTPANYIPPPLIPVIGTSAFGGP
jgi:hypothetical protein